MTTDSVVVQRQEQDVGCIEEGEVQTATLDILVKNKFFLKSANLQEILIF